MAFSKPAPQIDKLLHTLFIKINLETSYNSVGGINDDCECSDTYQSVKRASEPTLKLGNLPASGALYSVGFISISDGFFFKRSDGFFN